MSSDNDARALAQAGRQQIEDAILRLLDANPQGLRNVDIARGLGLSFDFGGNYKNQLTYGVLGRLLARGAISRDEQSKLFTSRNGDTTALDTAQAGLRQLEDAILRLLDANPQGLRNVEIAQLLDLHSDFQGGQRNYLTYTVLVSLVDKGKVSWKGQGRNKIYTRA